MNDILYQGLVGGAAGAIMAVIIMVVRKIGTIHKASVAKAEIEMQRPRLTRAEMIAGLRAMADDPATPEADRQQAAARLHAFEKLDGN